VWDLPTVILIYFMTLNFFTLVVGEKELAANSVNIRTRDNVVHGEFTVAQVLEKFTNLKEARTVNSEDTF